MSSISYANLVDKVHELDLEQKQSLADLLHAWIVEERRTQIAGNGEQAMRDYTNGKLPVCENVDDLMDLLNAGD